MSAGWREGYGSGAGGGGGGGWWERGGGWWPWKNGGWSAGGGGGGGCGGAKGRGGKGGKGGGGGGGGKGSGGRAPPRGGGGKAGKGGGGGKGFGGGAPRRRQPVPDEEIIYSTFPLNKPNFPREGPLSFTMLSQQAEDAGCTVTLRSRATQHRWYRAEAVLVIRGIACKEIYEDFLSAAEQLGSDLSRAQPLN